MCQRTASTLAPSLLTLALILLMGLVPRSAWAQIPTVTTLTSAPNPSAFGAAVTLTAVVDALGLPAATGDISFRNDGTEFALATLSALGIGVADVSAGGSHSCALANSGRVFCWGFGENGQLGNGGTAGRSVPVPVTGITNAVGVAAGGFHSCAVLQGGAVQCWAPATKAVWAMAARRTVWCRCRCR